MRSGDSDAVSARPEASVDTYMWGMLTSSAGQATVLWLRFYSMKRPFGLSVLMHALLGVGAITFALSHAVRQKRKRAEPERTFETLELPIMLEEPPTAAEAPMLAAGEHTPRIDTGTAGHGGEATASEQAVHLAARNEARSFTEDLLNSLERNQVTRVNSGARAHVSDEDDRMTPHPMELTFVTRGHGSMRELRKEGAQASLGVRRADAPVREGEQGQVRERADGEGEARLGREMPRAGQGVQSADQALGNVQTAPIATARPNVKQGAASVPAATTGKTADTTDSDQRVADAVRSIVQGSAFGGAQGQGAGGVQAAGDPGTGGTTGEGARPAMLGQGGAYDADARDTSHNAYYASIQRRVEPHVPGALPREAVVELKHGYVILDVLIAKNGSAQVVWPPVRPSGIDEFDRNCAAIVRRVAPFAPIPDALGKDSLRVQLRLRVTQPI
jgi:outer membrane biosynthesis protein TonB